jgi:hypothetical protein
MQHRLGGGAHSTLFRPLKKQLQGLSFSLRIIYIACLSDLKANIFPNPNHRAKADETISALSCRGRPQLQRDGEHSLGPRSCLAAVEPEQTKVCTTCATIAGI